MKFKVEIEMDNAAFESKGELPRILRSLAHTVDGHWFQDNEEIRVSVKDVNGNTVGFAELTDKE